MNITPTSSRVFLWVPTAVALVATVAVQAVGSVDTSPLQVPASAAATAQAGANGAKPAQPPPLPTDYVIGPEDVLSVVFATAKDMSTEVLVRPDGKISIPVVGDVPAVGMTPEQLALVVEEAAGKFVRDAKNTVIVKAIHSRKYYVIGQVNRQGAYPLNTDVTVLQALGEAGGFLEGADKDGVLIVRTENGKELRFKFNFGEVLGGKNLKQNIRLVPGDTILVK